MENLQYWNKFNKPPVDVLKMIGGGRLKGKTDINPQWRYRALTEAFGPCGIGWKYTIDELWSVLGSGEQVMAFARISLMVFIDDKWSDPIPGIGGSMLIEKEKEGLHTNDEGYKMAVTDALSVAAKMVGVGADVYMGRWDGSKYIASGGNGGKPAQNKKTPLSEKQLDEIRAKINTVEAFSSTDKTAFLKWLKEDKTRTMIANKKKVITAQGAEEILKDFDSLLNKYMNG